MSYVEKVTHIDGEDKGKIILFTLSTCIWCRKTKELLKTLGVEYSYVDVDLVEGDAATEVMDDMHKYNPNTSFPTFVFNDGEKVILGFEEDNIRECVG
jgi:glutaredoxin-like protein NrdH